MTAGLRLAMAPLLGLLVVVALRGTSDVSLTTALLAAAILTATAGAGEWLQRSPAHRTTTALLAGALATAALTFGADRSVLAWRFAAQGIEIRGVGIVLGAMLLATLGGTLVLAADRLAPGASPRAGTIGRRALMLAVALGAIAVALIVKEALFGEAALGPLAAVSGAIAAGTGLLGVAAAAWLFDDAASEDPARHDARASLLAAVAAAIGAGAVVAAGYEAWMAHGSVLAGATPYVLAAALAGVAAAQPTRFALARLLLFLGGLIGALAALL